MLTKITLKNPGCQFCRYYHASFQYKDKATSAACIRDARQVFQSKDTLTGKRNWKWVHCAIPSERNKEKTCEKFAIYTFWTTLLQQVKNHLYQSGIQYPPSFSGDKWWNV